MSEMTSVAKLVGAYMMKTQSRRPVRTACSNPALWSRTRHPTASARDPFYPQYSTYQVGTARAQTTLHRHNAGDDNLVVDRVSRPSPQSLSLFRSSEDCSTRQRRPRLVVLAAVGLNIASCLACPVAVLPSRRLLLCLILGSTLAKVSVPSLHPP